MSGIEEVMAVAAVATAATGAYTAIQAGNTAKQAADYNQQVDKITAGSADEAGALQEAQIEDQTRRKIASSINAASGTGTDISSGTPVDVMSDLARQGALDAEITRWNAGNKSTSALDQGQADAYSGTVAQQAGYTKAATSVLSSASNYAYGLYGRTSTTGTSTGGAGFNNIRSDASNPKTYG